MLGLRLSALFGKQLVAHLTLFDRHFPLSGQGVQLDTPRGHYVRQILRFFTVLRILDATGEITNIAQRVGNFFPWMSEVSSTDTA